MTILLPLLGILLGAALQYIFNRSLEGKRQLISQKSLAYADYFKSFANIARSGASKDHLTLSADAKTRICIYGSPEVVGKLADFERAGSTTNGEEGRQAILILFKAMRHDIGTDSAQVTQEDLNLILFGPPTKKP